LISPQSLKDFYLFEQNTPHTQKSFLIFKSPAKHQLKRLSSDKLGNKQGSITFLCNWY